MIRFTIPILALLLSGCSKNVEQMEKCADKMFILTNELMTQRLPDEAQPENAIREFLSNTYDAKREYDYYNALIKICENEYDRDPSKFNSEYR